MEQVDEEFRDNIGAAIEQACREGMDKEKIRDRLQDAANDLTRILGHIDYEDALDEVMEDDGLEFTNTSETGDKR